jgi:phosphatidylserine decarboxylase
MEKITFINRAENKQENELVYGDFLIDFFYKNKIGKNFVNLMINPPISKIVGAYHANTLSSKKIPDFIKKFDININEYEDGSVENQKIEKSYKTFNEFFIRKFKSGKRTFPQAKIEFGAFSEARYLGFDSIDDKLTYPVKGEFLNPEKILENSQYAKIFKDGPLLIARLCPVDYHRYHYFDEGKTIEAYNFSGKFHSVNPMAIKVYPNLFIENEKRISILDTKNFGKIAYVEVGAMCVGKIIQSANEKEAHKRGQEKGYFLFGASTVIVIGEPGKLIIDRDIIENTKNKMETYCKLGEKIGAGQSKILLS